MLACSDESGNSLTFGLGNPVDVNPDALDPDHDVICDAQVSLPLNSDLLTLAGLSMQLCGEGDIASSVETVDHSIGIFYDNIVQSQGTRIHALCFSLDPLVVRQLLTMHGILVNDEISLPEMQYCILRHLINDDCFLQC